MNVDCAGCVGNPHACDDCSIGFLLGPVVSVTRGDAEGTGRDSEMNEAIAVFAATGMLPGLRPVPAIGSEAAGRGGDSPESRRSRRAG